MADAPKLEVWLRRPLPDIPALLQPIAHALLQVQEEVHALMADFPENLLWERPANIASPAFHLQHLTGVLDRLFTYARGEALSIAQLNALVSEGKLNKSVTVQGLLSAFDRQIEQSISALAKTNEKILTDAREVGRAKLPSTVIGLLTHSAEHTTRHVGQLLVTIKILRQ
ncbi:DinB family protein [Emticicia sp. BO119]|uniref:DinB family protein n=1 Tax=Emticicia sp. BO119 TaxID=2757768 RepID=UPI0015F055A6|nr:DinB family protein [Emticicia sp. BO119]MBA4852330.1 DinB family protein [Emticicia sp. BO119]